MEGGVFEDERIIGIGSKRGRGDEKQGDKMGRLEKRPSGIVVIDENSYSGDEMINGVKYEEEKSSTPTAASTTPTATSGGGGLFNQLITNLVNSPKSNDAKSGHGGKVGGDEVVVVEKEHDVVKENGGHENDKENSGGESFVDDIVAKLPRTLSDRKRIRRIRHKKKNPHKTLAKDTVTVPEPDEASILLHSIIHD